MGVISSTVTVGPDGQTLSPTASKELGKDDFLQLLVTKLQYQDPLNPMKDEDFVAQLAQFSSLEQMSNIAEAIQQSNEWDFLQMQSVNNMMASGLIGKDVKADYSGVVLESDGDATLAFTLELAASQVQLAIQDSDGRVVSSFTLDNVPAGSNVTTWDGRDSFGNRLDAGYYTVTASAVDNSGTAFTPSMSLVGTVETIVYRDGGSYLTIGGMEIPLGDVQSVGERGSFTPEEE